MLYEVGRVARAHGRPYLDVLRDPYALTHLAFWQLMDHERIEGLAEDAAMLHQAEMATFAFHAPQHLGAERDRVMRGLFSADQVQAQRGALLTEAEALAQEIDRLEARGGAWRAHGSGPVS